MSLIVTRFSSSSSYRAFAAFTASNSGSSAAMHSPGMSIRKNVSVSLSVMVTSASRSAWLSSAGGAGASAGGAGGAALGASAGSASDAESISPSLAPPPTSPSEPRENMEDCDSEPDSLPSPGSLAGGAAAAMRLFGVTSFPNSSRTTTAAGPCSGMRFAIPPRAALEAPILLLEVSPGRLEDDLTDDLPTRDSRIDVLAAAELIFGCCAGSSTPQRTHRQVGAQ